MDGWMDGRLIDEWMCGRVDGRIDGWIDRCQIK